MFAYIEIHRQRVESSEISKEVFYYINLTMMILISASTYLKRERVYH
jgi:hypothetical protein